MISELINLNVVNCDLCFLFCFLGFFFFLVFFLLNRYLGPTTILVVTQVNLHIISPQSCNILPNLADLEMILK